MSIKGPSDSALAIRQAWVDFALNGREAEKSLDGDPLTGWSIDGEQGVPHRMVVALKDPLNQPTLATLVLLFERYYAAPLGRVRVWSTSEQVGRTHCAKCRLIYKTNSPVKRESNCGTRPSLRIGS